VIVDARPEPAPCTLQQRDVEILRALWAHHFLTTPQIGALWWAGESPRALQKRLTKLFAAGHVDRFRPRLHRGSFPWTYVLTRAGFHAAVAHRALPESARFRSRPLHNFQYVIHDLELNEWTIAYRRLIGDAFIGWAGEEESEIQPPRGGHVGRLKIEDGLTIDGLREPRPQQLRPDSVLELELPNDQGYGSFLVEYDRTRRADKIGRKLERYDAFLCWWWRRTDRYGGQLDAPYALFVCQDDDHVHSLLAAADSDLRGHEWAARLDPEEHVFPARERILFVNAQRTHAGSLEAWAPPQFPPGHPARRAGAASTELPAPSGDSGRDGLAA
jgi:hypothetical protein